MLYKHIKFTIIYIYSCIHASIFSLGSEVRCNQAIQSGVYAFVLTDILRQLFLRNYFLCLINLIVINNLYNFIKIVSFFIG